MAGVGPVIAGGVAVRPRKRRPIQRVVDGTPQPNVTEESPSRVEGDVIEEGRLIIEELLSARTRCRAPRAGTPVQDPADTEQRGRIVEILWKEIERSGIRKCDRLWRRDVMREHDALGIARTLSTVVGVPKKNRPIAGIRGDVIGTCGGDRL